MAQIIFENALHHSIFLIRTLEVKVDSVEVMRDW